MTEALVIDQPEDLLAREAALREGGATPRMRDAAAALGVPEAALVEARRATGGGAAAAAAEVAEGFGAVLARLPEAGEVMALTRNEACVHEVHGRFNAPEFQGAMGQVVGEIDLRLFTRSWAWGYLLDEETKAGLRKSLQFFDGTGTAIHKIYAMGKTDMAAFDGIVADFADPEAAPARFEPVKPPAAADGRTRRSTFPGCARPGRRWGIPTSSSASCAASASAAARRCASPGASGRGRCRPGGYARCWRAPPPRSCR